MPIKCPRKSSPFRYEVFHSSRSARSGRLMGAVRTDRTLFVQPMPNHGNNEFFCLIVKRGSHTFSLIAAYVSPKATLDENSLGTIFHNCSAPHIFTGGYNVNNRMGEAHFHIIEGNNWPPLKPIIIFQTSYRSCVDDTFVSQAIFSLCHSFTDTRGRD